MRVTPWPSWERSCETGLRDSGIRAVKSGSYDGAVGGIREGVPPSPHSHSGLRQNLDFVKNWQSSESGLGWGGPVSAEPGLLSVRIFPSECSGKTVTARMSRRFGTL